jgi:hypothetical protein
MAQVRRESEDERNVFVWTNSEFNRMIERAYACNETNLMHYLSLVYSVTMPLHVSA